MRTQAIIVMAAFLVSGCAGSNSRRSQQEAQAAEVYTAGSGFAGGGSSLLLFGWVFRAVELFRH